MLNRFIAASIVLLSVAFAAQAADMTAAADPTPLLWDRVRAFDAVLVVTTAEGFEKDPKAVPGTNSVYLPVKVEKVLKGDVKEGDFTIQVHQGLPPLLAKRDKETKHRYLLAVKTVKDSGTLMGGQLYVDLQRFIPMDEGVEKAVLAFMKAPKDTPTMIFKYALMFLCDEEMTPTGARAINEVLARAVAKATAEEWKALGKDDLQKMLKQVWSVAGKGSIDSAAAVLLAFWARTDNPDGLTVLDESLAEPARKYLADMVAKEASKDDPDYLRADSAAAVIALEGKLKDAKATDTLGKIISDERWKALRPKAIAAIKDIHGDKADEVLKPFMKDLVNQPATKPAMPRLIVD